MVEGYIAKFTKASARTLCDTVLDSKGGKKMIDVLFQK